MSYQGPTGKLGRPDPFVMGYLRELLDAAYDEGAKYGTSSFDGALPEDVSKRYDYIKVRRDRLNEMLTEKMV